MDAWLIPAPILLPLAAAFLMPILEHFSRFLRTTIAVLSVLGAFLLLLSLAPRVFGGEMLVYWMSDWVPRLGQSGKPVAIGISLAVDAWSLLIALVAAGIGLAALVYSTQYMRSHTGRNAYYTLVLLLISALIGFALSGDLFNQFVWLEVFSVAAFALTAFHVDHRVTVEGAFKYLITNSIASFFIAIGLALLYMNSGGLNLAHIARDFQPNMAGWSGVVLLIGGYATKAALVPWHFWLPDAHTVAPPPVSAIFSGALIKVGIYAVARCAFTLIPLQPAIQLSLLAISAITIVVGGIQMLQQSNMKRVLAFSSVAQMGYVMLALATGTPLGFAAGAMHLLHHALLKAALFMGLGNVVAQSGIHSFHEGGNLWRRLPITFGLTTLAALGLAGMPLFSGFISKTMIEEALTEHHLEGLAYLAILGSVLTFAGMARMIWLTFAPRAMNQARENVYEASPMMLLPIGVLVGLSLLIGLLPAYFHETLAVPVAQALSHREIYIEQGLGGTLPHLPALETLHHVPSPLDVKHWLPPALALIVGSLIAWAMMNIQRWWGRRWLPFRWLFLTLRVWHNGFIGDYALWNAFGTAALLLLLWIIKG